MKKRNPKGKDVFVWLDDPALVQHLLQQEQKQGESINNICTNAVRMELGLDAKKNTRRHPDKQGRLWVRITDSDCVKYLRSRRNVDGIIPKYVIGAAVMRGVKK